MKFVWVFALLSLSLFGCTEKQEAQVETTAEQAAEATEVKMHTAGEQLFRANCASCHPRSGRGDYLKRIPATLLTRRSGHELKEWIQGRDQHRPMPSFTNLTEEETAALLVYLQAEIAK